MQATGNNQPLSYSLSIRLHADGFSFYGYGTATAAPVATEHYDYRADEPAAATLQQALAQSVLAGQQQRPLMVYVLAGGPSMLVPLECFRKEEAHALYRLTYLQEKTGKTYYNILPHLEVAHVFTIDADTEKVLCQHFPNIRFYHSHTMVLEKMGMLETRGNECLYVYFREQEIFVFCYRGQQLGFANIFPADHTENIIYFILSVWKGLDIDRQEGECVLLGAHALKPDAARLLRRYLRNVREAAPADIFRRSALARDPQLPFDLLALLANTI